MSGLLEITSPWICLVDVTVLLDKKFEPVIIGVKDGVAMSTKLDCLGMVAKSYVEGVDEKFRKL